MSQSLERSFRQFASYGSSRGSVNDMTGKNFSKLCKECNIIEGGCTNTDVDIAFTKVKSKACHVINFEQFQHALELLSVKRFPEKPADEAVADIRKLVEGKEPASAGTTVTAIIHYQDSPGAEHFLPRGEGQKAVSAGVVDRLTDTSKYTGTHKERFDESGKGKGISGHVEEADTSGYVGAYKGAGTYDQKKKP